MINKESTYAVIWASNNTEKYGYKVFADLLQNNYKVFAINPNENKQILKQTVFPTLSSIWKPIDIAIFVVPPKVTEKILPEIKKIWIKKIWLQPWAESKKVIDYCEKNNIICIHNACIIIQRKN